MSEDGYELAGILNIIFEEVTDEIEEEFEDSLGGLITEERLKSIIENLKETVAIKVTLTIQEHYSEDMNSIKKMILGEKLSRIVSAETRKELQNLVLEILENSYDLIEELRNEIIGEVFEETTDEEDYFTTKDFLITSLKKLYVILFILRIKFTHKQDLKERRNQSISFVLDILTYKKFY